jgi:hypothetical protein
VSLDSADTDRFAGWPEPVIAETLAASEIADARAEVFEWAAELYEDQLQTWHKNMESYLARKRAWERSGRAGIEPAKPKAKPPTWEQCIAKSREIRIKRERDATYWNDTTNPYA